MPGATLLRWGNAGRISAFLRPSSIFRTCRSLVVNCSRSPSLGQASYGEDDCWTGERAGMTSGRTGRHCGCAHVSCVRAHAECGFPRSPYVSVVCASTLGHSHMHPRMSRLWTTRRRWRRAARLVRVRNWTIRPTMPKMGLRLATCSHVNGDGVSGNTC